MLKINKKIATATKLACNLLACGILNASAGGDSENCDSTSSKSNQPASVAVSPTEAPNPKKRALTHVLEKYIPNFEKIKRIKNNIEEIPADLRNLIKNYEIAKCEEFDANRSLEKLQENIDKNQKEMDDYLSLLEDHEKIIATGIFTLHHLGTYTLDNPIYSTISGNSRRIIISSSEETINQNRDALLNSIKNSNNPTLTRLQDPKDPIMVILQKNKDLLLKKVSLQKTLADTNRNKLEAYNTLNEAYNKSDFKRNIDSDLKLYHLLFATKNEFEDFIKNLDLGVLLASFKDMYDEKRYIYDINPKAAKIDLTESEAAKIAARIKLENQANLENQI